MFKPERLKREFTKSPKLDICVCKDWKLTKIKSKQPLKHSIGNTTNS